MLNFCHFQTHDLMRAKVTGVGPPITLIVSGLGLGLTMAPNLTPEGLNEGQVWALLIIQPVLSWAHLLTQLMAPDSINTTSCALPNSVLLMTATCRTGWLNQGQSLWLLLGQLCHLAPCLLQFAPAMHEMEVVLLSQLLWRSPVFPGSTESYGSQVPSSETGIVIRMGHSQMPLDLQGHSSHLMG